MTKINALLGTSTTARVTVDLDSWFVSFGPDSDNIHCWTCGRADLMDAGAWLIPGHHFDARLNWLDGDRYKQPVIPGFTDNRASTVTCEPCSRGCFGARKLRTLAPKA